MRCCCSREAARAAGATRFVVVSSVGASSNSKKFYLRTKGEMEEAVTDLGFASVDILQPSLLLGPRKADAAAGDGRRHLRAAHQSVADRCARSLARHPGRDRGAGQCWARRGVAARGIYRYTYAAIRQLAEIKPRAVGSQRNRPKRGLPENGAAAIVTRPRICAAPAFRKVRATQGSSGVRCTGRNATHGNG